MTSFDGLQFDVLNPLHGTITPQDIPEDSGVPINPMLAPADWSSSVVVRTRWQSDVTKPRSGSRESLSLASRPVRSLTVNLKGPAHGESYSVLQAIQQHAYVEAPVPLYPDAVDIAAAEHDSGVLTITADFSYRRFFVGCRVVVFSIRHRESQIDQRSMFGIVTELNAFSATVELESTYRTITSNDVIAPCIDTELSEGASGTMLTDGVVEIDVTWNEVEGGSTLPSLWPSAPHGDPALLAAIAQTASFDGEEIALFPGITNWLDGIDFELVTPADSSSLGRSRLLEVTQKPYVQLNVRTTNHDRATAWQVLRFFDAMQGRTGTFAFVHPIDSFDVVATTTNSVDITMVGSPQAARNQLRFIALVDNTGETHIRRVVQINDLTTTFRVIWNAAYPISNVVEARHVWVCSFTSDEIEEEWLTSGVTRIDFKLDELPEIEELEVDEDVFAYQPLVTDPLRSIPDCSLLLKAGVGCRDADDFLCTVWPGVHHRVDRIYDISRLPEPGEEFFNQVYGENISAFGNSAVVRLFDDAGFGTQPVLLQAPMLLSIVGQQNEYDSPWGPTGTGWTMFFVFSPRTRTSVAFQTLQSLYCPSSSLAFDIYLDTPTATPSFPGVYAGITLSIGGSTVNLSAGAPVENTGQARILAVRFDFATRNIQSWLDGAPFTTNYTYANPFPTAPIVEHFRWLYSSDGNSTISAATLRTIASTRMLGAAAVHYRRALTQEEMRAAYEALAEIYFAPTDTKIVVL